jgi:glycosyltransferase involved in cell wall biosynthesis
MISRCPPYPLHLGDRLIVWHLAQGLSRRGHTVDLLAYTQLPTDADERGAYASFFRHIELFPEPPRTTGDYLQRLLLPARRFPKSADASWSPAMWHAIEAQLKKRPYDVVHVFGGIQVYEFYNLVRDIPALITPYESYSLYLKRAVEQFGGVTNQMNRHIARNFERWMFAPYAATTVVAQPDKDELLSINPQLPVEVIGNGVDLDYFQLRQAPPGKYTLLFVGNYEYPPNVDAANVLATQILPEVRRQMPDVKLFLVGNAPPPEIQALQNEHIFVTGRVPDVREYHKGAAIFVSALRTGAGIKNKVLEALAMGVPVVATPLSVDGIAVEHNVSALIAEIPNMAAEIVGLLQDEPRQKSLAAAGRKLIEDRYSWTSIVAQYEALYEKIRQRAGFR